MTTAHTHDGLTVVGSLAAFFGSGLAVAAAAAESGTYALPTEVAQALRHAADAIADLGSTVLRAEIDRLG